MRNLPVRFAVLASLTLLFMVVGIPIAPALAVNCGTDAGGPGVDIPCSCGNTVITDTTLDGAFDPVVFAGPCPGTGLIVNAGLTLNLGDNTIRGKIGGGDGILLAGDGIHVLGGRIVGFGHGVFGNTDDSKLSNLQLRQNRGDGAALTGDRNIIEKCVADRNAAFGLSVVGKENIVRTCRVELNGHGVSAGGGADNTITRCVINRNSGDGAQVSGTSAAVGINQMKFNGCHGLAISGSGHFVSRNVNQSNGCDGTEVSASGSDFDRNGNSNNDGFGIRDTNIGTPNTYTRNICAGNRLGDSDPANLCR
jgi:hypothetical protein